jgi:hypothetical protein
MRSILFLRLIDEVPEICFEIGHDLLVPNPTFTDYTELLEFWTFFIVRCFLGVETRRFGNLDLFPSSGGGEEDISVGLLSRGCA